MNKLLAEILIYLGISIGLFSAIVILIDKEFMTLALVSTLFQGVITFLIILRTIELVKQLKLKPKKLLNKLRKL